jgi:peptidoglycan hydrolase-like protein with peptidoglycan-binding domain
VSGLAGGGRRRGRATGLPVSVLFSTLLALAAATAPAPWVGSAEAFGGAFYPTQSRGDRGVDVRALQHLLRQQQLAPPTDGVYGTSTRDAVKLFQSRRGLPITGITDTETWRALVVPLELGRRGPAVRALQLQLRAKNRAVLNVDGVFGETTARAVVAFQRHAGIRADGIVYRSTWRNLLWHYDYPAFGVGGLCDYSTGNGTANWGTGSTVGAIEKAGAIVAAAGLGRLPVGDLSLEHGGEMAGHTYHEVGLEADLRPMRDARDQCSWGTRYYWTSYDRAATRALIRALRASGHVKLIYFNDPVLIGDGLTRYYAGHDDHLHVRFCLAIHPDPLFQC